MSAPPGWHDAPPVKDLVREADRILAAAKVRGVIVRLAGGLAIRRLCPAASHPPLSREYADIDLAVVGLAGHRSLTNLMISLGYQPDEQFNNINGGSRLHYDDTQGRHVDVFIDAVRMCHVIEFKRRLTLLEDTLTPTDLLLTKLQIVELNHKDLLDATSLLHDRPIERGAANAIDTAYLEEVWADDWPLWRTCQLTLGKFRQAMPTLFGAGPPERVMRTLSALEGVLKSSRKTLRWSIRARVGDRIKWYETPEEVG